MGHYMHPFPSPLEALLDLIDFGIILADPAGTVVAANAAARETAAAWSLLAFEAEAPDAPPVLANRSIVEAASLVSKPTRGKLRVVTEVLLRDPRRRDSLLVTAVSLPMNSWSGEGEAVFRASCALFFRNSGKRPPGRIQAVLKQLGFTPAESELAMALLEGLTLDECCVRLGRTRNTLRSRLKAMLAKTGVHRQGQLITLILKSAPQIRVERIQHDALILR